MKKIKLKQNQGEKYWNNIHEGNIKLYMDIMDIWKHFSQTDVEFFEGDKQTPKHIWRARLCIVCRVIGGSQ